MPALRGGIAPPVAIGCGPSGANWSRGDGGEGSWLPAMARGPGAQRARPSGMLLRQSCKRCRIQGRERVRMRGRPHGLKSMAPGAETCGITNCDRMKWCEGGRLDGARTVCRRGSISIFTHAWSPVCGCATPLGLNGAWGGVTGGGARVARWATLALPPATDVAAPPGRFGVAEMAVGVAVGFEGRDSLPLARGG